MWVLNKNQISLEWQLKHAGENINGFGTLTNNPQLKKCSFTACFWKMCVFKTPSKSLNSKYGENYICDRFAE